MRKTIISDMDGTLVRGSMVLDHAVFLEQNGIIDTQGATFNWLNDMKNEKLIVDLAMAYQRAITGMSIEDIKISDFISTLSMEHLTNTANQLKNSNTLLITGSPSFLAEPFAKILEGIFNCSIKVEGSIYEIVNGKLTGKITRPAFTGKEKIISENPHFKNSMLGLGDTLSDKAIFENCKRNMLVNPSMETIKGYMNTGIQLEITD